MIKPKYVAILRCLLIFCLFGVFKGATSSPSQILITLDPAIRHQKITGWEYVDGISGGPNSLTYPPFLQKFNRYKNSLYDQAADLGLNRVKFNFSGGIEGSEYDVYWAKYLAGQIVFEATYKHVTNVVSSNPDPNVLDLKGFQFASSDWQINNMILPMKQRVEAKGEKFYFIGCYNGFWIPTGNLHDDPAFYARFVLAVFEHMKQTFGFVPDIWEMMNEPENVADWQSGARIGPAMVKTAAVLAAHGYHPKFAAPSPSYLSDALPYFDKINSVSGATSLLSEFTYHYYTGWNVSRLQQIGALGLQYGFDTGMNESAGMNYIHHDLKYANNSFWMMGGLADVNYEPNNAAYFVVDSNNNVTPESNTLIFRQYFHYIRPGAVRIDANSQNTNFDPVAFINANGSYVVVVKAASAGNNITVSNLPTGTYGITDSLGGRHADYSVTKGTLSTQISGAGYLTIFGTSAPTPPPSPPANLKILTTEDGGSATFSTAGLNETTQTGYASIAVDSGTPPYGTGVFSLEQNGVTISEAGVPASPPTTAARVFIDYRSSVNAIPAHPEAGSINVSTGIAVANSGSSLAHITYTLRNVAGVTVSAGHGILDPGHHFAKFIDQIKDVAAEFALPEDFQTTTQFGSLEISSDKPVSVVALRIANNQRNEMLYTTTPIADLTQPITSDVVFFPEFADGGGYTTSIILVNTSSQIESGIIQVMDDDGNPVVANWFGDTADSMLRYIIPVGAAARFQTDGFPTTSKIGWAKLIPDAGTSTPIGAGLFSYNPGKFLQFESGVPATLSTIHARIYVDLSGGHNTGLALANPTDSSTEISMKAFQSDGVTQVGTSNDPLQLMAKGHQAHFANEFVSGLPAEFRGVMDISSPTPFAALTLRSLDNERHEFLAALFPIADMTRDAPAPIVFPQIADGRGYTTEFILIGANGASSTTLKFYDDDGNPLAVGR
jgi:hypothetical protein